MEYSNFKIQFLQVFAISVPTKSVSQCTGKFAIIFIGILTTKQQRQNTSIDICNISQELE